MNRSTLEKELGLPEPWKITKDTFSIKEQRLDITIDFQPGSTFPCPECGAEGKAYDTERKTWRHLSFFQHETYLHARKGVGSKRWRCPGPGSAAGFPCCSRL